MKYLLSAAAFYLAGHVFVAAYTKEIPAFWVVGVVATALGVASLFIKND